MYRPLFSFRHVIYEMSKELFDENKKMKAGLQQWFNFIYGIGVCHLLYITVVLYDQSKGELYDFRRHDMLLAIIFHFREELEYTTIFMLYPFSLLYLALEHYTFRLDVRGQYWRYWWQLTVLNLDQYRKSQLKTAQERNQVQAVKEKKYLEKVSALPFFGSFIGVILQQTTLIKRAAYGKSVWNLDFVDLEKISRRPLPLLPHASWPLRRRTIFTLLYFEVLTVLGELALLPVYWATVVVFAAVYPDWSGHTLLSIGFVLVEIAVGYFVLHILARYGLFFTCITVLGTMSTPNYLIEVQAELKKVCFKKGKKSVKIIPLKRKPLIDNFLVEHTRLCTTVVETSRTLYGPLIFATVLTMIPSNVIFVRRIFLLATPPSLRLIFLLVFVIQSELVLFIFVPLSWCHQVYHCPKRFIPGLLLRISAQNSGWMRTKLKYDDLYGRLMSGPKLGLSVGPMHTITYFSSLEVLLLSLVV